MRIARRSLPAKEQSSAKTPIIATPNAVADLFNVRPLAAPYARENAKLPHNACIIGVRGPGYAPVCESSAAIAQTSQLMPSLVNR